MKWFVAVLVVAGCASSSSKAPTQQQGRASHVRIGELDAYVLADGFVEVPNDGKLLGFERPPSETAELLAAAGLRRDPIRLDIQCLLVMVRDRVILFDTGASDAPWAKAGHLQASLARANVAPIAVTDVFISHAHGDHVGGLLTKAGALAFPAATIRMSAPEWASLQANTDVDSRRMVAAIGAKVVTFEPGAQVLPVVKAVDTRGHTPGHSSYEIGTETDKLFYLGDVAHHAVISVQRPAWSIQVDGDRPAAEEMRQKTFAELAAARARVFVVHFPFPGTGRFAAAEQGFVWQPE